MPKMQAVGIFLRPLKRCRLAVNANAQAIAFARGDLRTHQHAGCAIVQLQQRGAVIIHAPAFHDRTQRSVNRRHPKARGVLDQMKRMRADVADAAARPVQRGIDTPARLLLDSPGDVSLNVPARVR